MALSRFFVVAALLVVVAVVHVFAQPGVCYVSVLQRQAYTAYVREYYSDTYRCGSWFRRRRCTRQLSRSVPRTLYRNIPVATFGCCSGYRQSGSSCIPICTPECDHGQCAMPDSCSCDDGFTGSRCREGVCLIHMLLSATSTMVAVSSFVTIRLAVSRVHATVGIHYHSMAFCVMM